MADGELIFDTKIDATGFSNGVGKLGEIAQKSVAGIAKATAAVTSAASTAIGAMAKQATSCYADYEQLIGGVETLFKGSADKVEKYASEAFKNVGMSGNEYMETVTGFAASLISSLGNDTDAAAEKANMALTDMSDNANKMGSDLESIKNAYAGFSKQNYTMLDNLKLGYGGTKEEMQRLLDKAEEIQRTKFGVDVDYDISSFADIVDAIHVIQTEMDITGTTAKEASTTIQGSISALKAAWTDLMTGIADPTQDLDRLLENVVGSVVTVADNLAPRIAAVLPQMADGLTKLTNDLLPLIPETINNLLPSVLDGADSLIKALLDTLAQLGTTAIPIISDNIGNIVDTLVSGLSEAAPELAEPATKLVSTLAKALADNTGTLTQGAIDIVLALANSLIDETPELVPSAVQAVGTVAEGLVNNLDKILTAGGKIIKSLAEALVDPKTLNVFATEIPKVVDSIVLYIGENLNDLIVAGYDIAESIVKGIFNYDWAGTAEEVGRLIHQGEVEAEKLAMEEKHSDEIAKWGKMTLDELNNELVRIKDEMGKTDIYATLYDYMLEGKGELEDALSDGLISQDIFDEVKSCGEDTFMYLQKRIEDTDAAYTDLEEQSKLITDIIAKENAKLSEGTKLNKEWQKSIADGYAENARNAANTSAWVYEPPDTAEAEETAENIEEASDKVSDAFKDFYNTLKLEKAMGDIDSDEYIRRLSEKLNSSSEYASAAYTKYWNEVTTANNKAAKKSSDKVSDDFENFYDNLKFLKSKGVKNGGISEADYLKQLSDKLHSSEEYNTAPYASYWEEIKDSTKKATDTITDEAKDQWKQIERLNKLGIYNDKQAQAERLKWIKTYCPKYADEYYDYYSEVSKYQQSAEAESLKSTKKTLSKQADIVKDKLTKISSEYQTKYKEIQSKISTYKSALLSVGKTFSIEESEDKNGNKTKVSKVADVAKRLEQMKKYHESLIKLRDMDASPALLTEIINLGAEDGAYMAEHLVKDKNFSKFNDLYKQLDTEAQSMANDFYAPDVQKLNDDTAAKITAAYSDLPTEFGTLGAAAAEAFVSGMSGDISDKITQNITDLTNGVSTALDSMKTDFNLLDFLDSSDFKQAGVDAGQEFSKGFSSAVSEIDAAKNSINEGAASLAPPVYSSSGTSASGGSTDTVINAKIYTTVTLDGDKVGQSVTSYQFRHSQEGGS